MGLCSNTYFDIRIDWKCQWATTENICIIVCVNIVFKVTNIMKDVPQTVYVHMA